MKIALVSVRTDDSCFPINLLSLHAYMQHFCPQHTVEIVDAAFEDPLERILTEQYDLVGIGAMTADYEAATKLAKALRKVCSTPIILGGVHISTLPDSFRTCFDVGVMGEGEEPLRQLVALYEHKRTPTAKDYQQIGGLVFIDEGKLKQTPLQVLSLDNYPHLDYSALHAGYFQRKASPSFGRFGSENFIITSRGCPFRCVFCASSHFWNQVRYFSVDWIIEEIKSLASMGVDLVNIVDDLFVCNKKRLKDISERIQAENLHKSVTFSCGANPSIFDDEICSYLQAMNVKPIFFGFESGDDQILQYLKCGRTSVNDNKEAVLRCQRYGFYCWGGLIIGSPGETSAQIENTINFIEWAKKHGVVRLIVSILHPFPGTPVWDVALKMGRVNNDMDFDLLKLDNKYVTNGLLVDDGYRAEFITMRDKTIKHIHGFKWVKARMLFRHSPIETLIFAFKAPWPIIKRLLMPSMP